MSKMRSCGKKHLFIYLFILSAVNRVITLSMGQTAEVSIMIYTSVVDILFSF